MTNVLKRYNDARIFLLNDAGILLNLSLAFIFAVALSLASQIKIYLGFTPVPINLATLVVCASALTLGGFWSFISVAIFILAGVTGLPVFASTSIFSATTGYLVGYALCAYILGRYSENRKNGIVKTSIVLFLAQIFIIHLCGMIGLYIWSSYTGINYTVLDVIMKGSIPFLIGDSIKAIITSYSMAYIIKK